MAQVEVEEKCPKGFQVTGSGHCRDINECLITDYCSHQALCVNTDGAAYCNCPDGWHLSLENEQLCLGKSN